MIIIIIIVIIIILYCRIVTVICYGFGSLLTYSPMYSQLS